MELREKIKNNEGKLPWDDGYMPYTSEELLLIYNLAATKLGYNPPTSEKGEA